MSNGKQRVERIPRPWVEEVRERVQAGRDFQNAVREVLTANAECSFSRGSSIPNDTGEDSHAASAAEICDWRLAAERLSASSWRWSSVSADSCQSDVVGPLAGTDSARVEFSCLTAALTSSNVEISIFRGNLCLRGFFSRCIFW
jgi:hypothetical protein